MPQHAEGNGFEVKSPWFSMVAPGKRMAEVIALVCLFLMGGVGYGAWSLGLRLADSMNAMSAEQRRMTCIISMPTETREAALVNPNSLCNRMAER